MRISQNLQENFPFISVITYVDNAITSIYDYSSLRTEAEKTKFLELGEIWWWESNRQIPISIFLAKEMLVFRYIIRNFSTKDVKVMFGPVTSLNDIMTKRVKRKSITLIRKPPK